MEAFNECLHFLFVIKIILILKATFIFVYRQVKHKTTEYEQNFISTTYIHHSGF